MNLVQEYLKKIFGKSNLYESASIFIIGDSFIQAEEIPYEETFYGRINSESKDNTLKAYGMGFGSWNSIQYLKVINLINKKNSIYDIYLFGNDFTPSYARSSFREQKKITKENQFNLRKLLSKSILIQKIYNSLIYYKTNSEHEKENYSGLISLAIGI